MAGRGGSDLWVTTIQEFPVDAPGLVPWWSRSDVKLFAMMIHVLRETTRHAGHADILRDQLDGRTGVTPDYVEQIDMAAREAYRAKLERAARERDNGSRPAGLSDTHGAVGTVL